MTPEEVLENPVFTPGPDSPAWAAAMGDADRAAERYLEYWEFLVAKQARYEPSGFEIPEDAINSKLFPFQRDVVRWCLSRGKAACFAATGLGKTAIQLEWAWHVFEKTGRPVLILAPLAVGPQTKLEGEKFGIHVTICRSQADVQIGLNITNYELLDKFDTSLFSGVVCDESSVMKDWTAATTKGLKEAFRDTPYKLCCSATPSPNDHTELGTHSEFLGVMTRMEMLSMYFCHDGGNTSEWRLKGHARKPFWRWLASWAISLRKPSDLGYSDDGYILPRLHIVPHVVDIDLSVATEGMLFRCPNMSATAMHKEMRLTSDDRAAKVAELIRAEPDEQWLVLCNTDYEATSIKAAIPNLVEVRGKDSLKSKEDRLLGFTTGNPKDMLSKSSICGWGLNYQHCARIAIAGLSYSFEQFYQVIRRCWRYGQKREVFAHLIYAETEGPVYDVIKAKESQHEELQTEMNEAMKEIQLEDRHRIAKSTPSLRREHSERWDLVNGDCVSVLANQPDESIDYSIFSPPFASLYVYSDSEADMGNCRNHGEFYEHLKFLVVHLFRTLKSGRLVSFHCMNLPMTKQHDGQIGLVDFRGDLIRLFVECGFIYHSEVVIWKNPVTAMQRTKALGLLHKQVVKDSAMSRQGIPDYLVTMRKPGINREPVAGRFDHYIGAPGTGPDMTPLPNSLPDEFGNIITITRPPDFDETRFSIEIWQRYASPVWMDIDQSDTLQRGNAREEPDERHICALQTQVIERAIDLWSNPGDLVLSPFAGIGSEGHVAVRCGRAFLGVELKESYFDQAVANLKAAEKMQHGLFSMAEETVPAESDPWA